jgi:hypothetical protein
MDPYSLELPKTQEDLIILYRFFDKKTHDVWREYVIYCESLLSYPRANLIFPIIFTEINFCEEVMARIRVHLSEESLRDINYDEFSAW